MKILLTGASGMVGKNILEHPESEKHSFITPTSSELNLLNYEETFNYISKQKPDLIIHSAGIVGGIQANIKNPVKYLTGNLDIGRNIILASRYNLVKKLINLGSSCMYPRKAENPLNEELILTGQLEPTNEGYALAKIVALKLCEYIVRENSVFQYKTVIPCNLYGRYDKFDPETSHMIPAVIDKIHRAKLEEASSVEIWGDGKARREFMYASDLADFIHFTIDNFEKIPQNINIGLGEDYTIDQYYKIISKVVGYNGKFKYNLSKPVGMKQKLVDINHLKNLGWNYKTSLTEGIEKTYEYYKDMIYDKE